MVKATVHKLVTPVSNRSRRIRRPVHNFYIQQRPWQLAPFMVAPVLPGETLRNLLLQSNAVTDPIKNSLIGWWLEHYFFYVKLRDLDARATISSAMLDLSVSLSGLNEAANVQYYHGWTTIPWLKLAVKRIVEEHFRQPGEAWDTWLINGLPAAKARFGTDVLDSAVTNTQKALNAVDVELTVGVDDKFTMSEFEGLFEKWQMAKQYGFKDLTFEDYLAEQGVSVPIKDDTIEQHKPELIRFVRNWQLPSNTVNPSTGGVASAVRWVVTERADKDRFFAEPGFVVGISLARPKIYYSKQAGSAVGVLTDALAWLPDVIASNDPFMGLRSLASGSNLLTAQTDSYWIDICDLLEYGEQFCNFTMATTGLGQVALPTAALQKRYCASTDADALFVDTTAGVGKMSQDGSVSLMVATRSKDQTQTV